MNNIVKVNCMHFWSDWTDMKDIEINLDEYVFFSIEWRGIDNWHIVGYKVDAEHNWTTEELSDHQVSSVRDLADFIVYANAYPKSKGKFQDCKVSRFNNLHYGGNFYSELLRLLKMVADKEAGIKADGRVEAWINQINGNLAEIVLCVDEKTTVQNLAQEIRYAHKQ